MEEKNNNHKKFSPEEEKQMWENILAGIRTGEEKKRLKKNRIYTAVAAAVILLFLSSIISYNHFLKPDIYTALTENSDVTLSDGSVVTLIKGAKLTVEKSFPAGTRDVFLEGNAVFHVAKSKEHPFIVHGLNYETKVLGTVFKVTQHGSTFNVDLYEGKVLVYRKGDYKEPVILKPQQTFTNFGILEAGSVAETEDIKPAGAEDKSAALTFNKCPINDAVRIIEKTYGIKVHYPAEMENTRITAAAPSASAEAFLQTLALQLNLNIRKNNDSIYELEN